MITPASELDFDWEMVVGAPIELYSLIKLPDIEGGLVVAIVTFVGQGDCLARVTRTEWPTKIKEGNVIRFVWGSP